MKGTILHLDEATGTGLLRAEDGQRYAFGAADLRGSGQLALVGMAVDFELAGGRAVEIYPDPQQPLAQVLTRKSRMVAGLLALFAGTFGVHKFYLGYPGAGLVMFLCTTLGWMLLWIPTGIVALIALIEAVIYMTRSDEGFAETYVAGRRPWF